ncbi:hypothetical protein D3C80_1143900 [compost metagenome]
MAIVVPAGAVPCITGWVSSVAEPLVRGPWTSPVLSVTVVMDGGGGAVVSTVKVNPPDAVLTLPALSIAAAVRVCCPFGITMVGVNVQAPPSLTTAVPICEPSRRMLMVVPGSPVPLSVGRLSLVVSLILSAPVRPGTSSISWVMTGAAGARLLTVILQLFDVSLRLSASSTATAVKTCPPSGKCTTGVNDQLPLESTLAVPIWVSPL